MLEPGSLVPNANRSRQVHLSSFSFRHSSYRDCGDRLLQPTENHHANATAETSHVCASLQCQKS